MTVRRIAVLLAVLVLGRGPAVVQAQPAPRIAALTPDELRAVRSLAARGAAALVHAPDMGLEARNTVVLPVHAPLDAVRRALVAADEWPRFLPALRAVEPLSRSGRRAAWRFVVSASVLEVTATCMIHEASERRVDVSVLRSDFGPAGARWDLLPEGPSDTLVVVTSWSDPTQGHWLLRRWAAQSPTATAGMNVAVDLTLALAVGRRAAALAGTSLPVRPARTFTPVARLDAPPQGPWLELVRHVYVLGFVIDPDGAVASVSVAGDTGPVADRVLARLDDPARWPALFALVRAVDDRGSAAHGARRFQMVLDGTWEHGEGELLLRRLPGSVVRVEGATDSFARAAWRWDVWSTADARTVVVLTGGVEDDLATSLQRVVRGREPYLAPGFAALRELQWVRQVLGGL